MNAAGSVLLDTNVVVAHFRNDPNLTARLRADNDIWIAAMARQFDLPLVTRDSHFAAIPALKTLAW